MGSYTYLRKREDGDFDHVEVDEDNGGTETVFGLVKKEDEEFPWGRPTDEEIAEEHRSMRNEYLLQTDVWALSDRTPTQAQKDYRQALRDLPTHSSWPHLNDEDWPVKPEQKDK